MSQSRAYRRELLIRAATVTGAVASLVALAVVTGRQTNARLVRARHEVVSPSGRFVAGVEVESDGGVRVWRPYVRNGESEEVYRADSPLTSRPAPRIMWESDLDTLWVVQADGTASFVQEGLHGWTSTDLADDDRHLMPVETRG
ncbi:MAG: hypothetical protein ACK5MT_02645 [Actinomycetales bacterium]